MDRVLPIELSISPDFFSEEVRCGYVVSTSVKELWAVELDLLAEFMRVCKKNGIVFYADAGTILGAVRHKGFVPWDDDIDVMLMRDQYEKLSEIATKEFSYPYFYQTEYTDEGSARGHAQLRNSKTTGILRDEMGARLEFNQGIFIDIFPIDAIPDDEDELEKMHKSALREKKKYTKILKYGLRYKKSDNIIKRIPKHIIHIFHLIFFKHSYKKHYMNYERICKCCMGKKTRRVAKLFDLPLAVDKRIWPRVDFDSVVYMPFEMLSIPVPSGYRDILDRFYGNWSEYRIGKSTHGELIFDVFTPYDKYQKSKQLNESEKRAVD